MLSAANEAHVSPHDFGQRTTRSGKREEWVHNIEGWRGPMGSYLEAHVCVPKHASHVCRAR